MISPESDSRGVMRNRKSAGQLVRCGVVSIATNLLGYFVYLLATSWGIEPKVYISFMYPAAAAIGFFGNRQWAFAHKGAMLRSGFRYFVAQFFGYLINLYILFTFVDRMGYPHQWVQAAAFCVVAVFLFVAFKYFVFPKAQSFGRGGK